MATSDTTAVGDATADTITVLLVDDNEQWVELLSEDLENEGPFSTITVLNANEALLTLRERADIECIVADYRMPEIDGLQLLQRVREEWGDLPFILLTGMGSEDIASQAIREGVSDYFRKDPRTNEVPLLANRIEQAVDQARLRENLQASEERYRTITEQVAEGITIVEDGEIQYCNDRFVELTGFTRAWLEGADFVESLVIAADRSAVKRSIRDTGSGEGDDGFHGTRIRRHGAKPLDIEYSVRRLPFSENDAVILSIRDVTEIRARERNLERERRFNRTVQRALIETKTRGELEEEIANLLHEDGYSLVWVGQTAGEELRPTTVTGQAGYLDAIELSTASDRSPEPSIWTVRTGRAQFPGDFEDAFSTHWRDRALDHGFRTGAALPIEYESVTYGVLAVYHDDPYHIDEEEKQLLAELSQTLAFAIHHIELRKSLSSSDVAFVELELTDSSYYLPTLAGNPVIERDDISFTVIGTHPYDDGETIQYIELDGIDTETFRDLAGSHPTVQTVQPILDDSNPRVQVTLSSTPPELSLTQYGAVIHRTLVTPNTATLKFTLQSQSDLAAVVSYLGEHHGTVDVRSTVSVERQHSPMDIRPVIQLADLTDKQAAALQAAYHHGYFDQPRRNAATDIAESLGVVHSTYLQHLRAAQRKVFGTLYAADETLTGGSV